MGSGSVDAVLAADINSLIQNPIVLFGAAAVVVVAVVVVLIMVLRGGSKKDLMPDEYEGGEAGWAEAQRGAAQPSERGHGSKDQALPWEQGTRGDGGRPPAGGRRSGRSGQDWEQPDAGQRDQGWGNQGQGPARGGQGGADQWGQPEPVMGAAAPDRRNGQGQGTAWGRGAEQGAMGWGNDEWGQAPAANAPAARGGDEWGQPAAARRNDDQWGQPAAARRNDDQWGQPPTAGRNDDQWGQAQQGRGNNQNQWDQQDAWGQPAQAPNRGSDQWEQQSVPPRGARSGGMEAPAQASGQAKNAGWGTPATNSDWEETIQPQRSAQASRNSRPAANEWGQPAQDTADEWGRSAQGGESEWGQPAAGSWGTRDAAPSAPEPAAPAWQTPGWGQPEPEQPPRSRSGAWGQQQSPSTSHPQRSQPEQPAADAGWSGPGVADHWGQPAAPPPTRNSRPMGQEMSRQPAPAFETDGANGWGAPAQESAASAQPDAGWGGRDAAPAWQAPEAPARQAPPAQQGPRTSPVTPAPQRNVPDIAGVSPDSTAYSPAKSTPESAAESERTVVMRKDSGSGERMPGVVIRQGKEAGRTYEMRKETLRIGRSRESDIFLEDLAVSRLHATIYRDEMGTYHLRDEHSANGTTVNGQRIFSEHTLQEGDEIQLGQTILAFVRR
jgi:hypothetical protein